MRYVVRGTYREPTKSEIDSFPLFRLTLLLLETTLLSSVSSSAIPLLSVAVLLRFAIVVARRGTGRRRVGRREIGGVHPRRDGRIQACVDVEMSLFVIELAKAERARFGRTLYSAFHDFTQPSGSGRKSSCFDMMWRRPRAEFRFQLAFLFHRATTGLTDSTLWTLRKIVHRAWKPAQQFRQQSQDAKKSLLAIVRRQKHLRRCEQK